MHLRSPHLNLALPPPPPNTHPCSLMPPLGAVNSVTHRVSVLGGFWPPRQGF